jgi:tetrahydromethanopterin S-methyltransferase subunit F
LFLHFYFYRSAAKQSQGLSAAKKAGIIIGALVALIAVGVVLGVVFGLHSSSCKYIYR